MSQIPQHGELAWVAHADLRPGPNPRRTFDEAELAALADSIAAQGLLQNLVVTLPLLPDLAANGVRVIVAGERRYRAIGLLIEQGRWDAAHPIPCRLVDADPGTIRALALLENLQRQDVPPLEEAEAFRDLHAMDGERWSVAAIAAAIGRTPRYVQQRIAVATKLAPEAKALLADGKLTFTQARELVTLPAESQGAEAAGIARTARWGMEDLRRRTRSSMFDMRLARFPREAYAGELYEAEDGTLYALDRAAAVAAQRVWAEQYAKDTSAELYLDAPEWWGNGNGGWLGKWREATAAEAAHAVTVVAVRISGEVVEVPNLVPADFRLAAAGTLDAADSDEAEDDDDCPARPPSPRFQAEKAWRDAIEAIPPQELLRRLSTLPTVALKGLVDEIGYYLSPTPDMRPEDALLTRSIGIDLPWPEGCSVQDAELDGDDADAAEARRLLEALDLPSAAVEEGNSEALAVIAEAMMAPVATVKTTACAVCHKPTPRPACHYASCPAKAATAAEAAA